MSDIATIGYCAKDFLDEYNFETVHSSYGEQYLLLDLEDYMKMIVVPMNGDFKRVETIISKDLSLYQDSVESQFDKYVFYVMKAKQILSKLCVNFHAIFVNYNVSEQIQANVIVTSDPISNLARALTYFVLEIDNCKFLLCDNFATFDVVRKGIKISDSAFRHAKRVVYSWDQQSINFFDHCNKASYNTAVIKYFIKKFDYHPSVTDVTKKFSLNGDDYGITFICYEEMKFVQAISRIPYIEPNSASISTIHFPQDFCINEKFSITAPKIVFSKEGKWMTFPIVLKFKEFNIEIHRYKITIVPINDICSLFIPQGTNIKLPVRTTIKYGAIKSCDNCQNYFDHSNICMKADNDHDFCQTKHLFPYSMCSIVIKNFKDSANLVRSNSISKLLSMASLCNLTSPKYSNKFSKISPQVFLNAYDDYDRKVSDAMSLESYLKRYETSNGSWTETDNLDKQFDIYPRELMTTNLGESDKPLLFIGLRHNVTRFEEFFNVFKTIFVLPDNCTVEWHYTFHADDDFIHIENEKQPENLDMDDYCSSITDMFPLSRQCKEKYCKDFLSSSTPFCDHNEFILPSCTICKKSSEKSSDKFASLCSFFGLGYEDNNFTFMTYAEKCYELVPIWVKPNGLKGENFSILCKNLRQVDSRITLDAISKPDVIPESLFRALYPSAADGKRKFSKHWYNYMTSGNSMLMILRCNTSYHAIRNACLQARKDSGLEWTKNIVHSAENGHEAKLFLEEIINANLDIIEPLNYVDGFDNYLFDFQPSLYEQRRDDKGARNIESIDSVITNYVERIERYMDN